MNNIRFSKSKIYWLIAIISGIIGICGSFLFFFYLEYKNPQPSNNILQQSIITTKSNLLPTKSKLPIINKPTNSLLPSIGKFLPRVDKQIPIIKKGGPDTPPEAHKKPLQTDSSVAPLLPGPPSKNLIPGQPVKTMMLGAR